MKEIYKLRNIAENKITIGHSEKTVSTGKNMLQVANKCIQDNTDLQEYAHNRRLKIDISNNVVATFKRVGCCMTIMTDGSENLHGVVDALDELFVSKHGFSSIVCKEKEDIILLGYELIWEEIE